MTDFTGGTYDEARGVIEAACPFCGHLKKIFVIVWSSTIRIFSTCEACGKSFIVKVE
jgi:transcription elongation factor Elf1